MWLASNEYIPDPLTLEKLRKEFRLGELSCVTSGAVLFVYIRIDGNLVASIETRINESAAFVVLKINVVVDQEGATKLTAVAEREKIPIEFLTKKSLKQIAKCAY